MRAVFLVLAISAAATADDSAKPSDAVAAFVHRTLQLDSYKRADADLNGDGRSEAFVYVTDLAYCGSGGCTLIVLSPDRRGSGWSCDQP